jgi:hypothetical protein
MTQTLVTAAIIVVVASTSAWYFLGMPGLEMATAAISDVTASAPPVAP